jgi:hypothetical protein
VIEEQSHHLEAAKAGDGHAFGRPLPNLTSTVAIVTVLAISVGSIGALIAARHNRPVAAVASGARLASPTPSAMPNPSPVAPPQDIQLVAPSSNVVWALVDHQLLYRSTDQGNTWLRFRGSRPAQRSSAGQLYR